MSSDVATLARGLTPIRESRPDDPVVPVLIRVPALRQTARRRARRRRRLRREIRFGGLALLVSLPVVGLGVQYGGSVPPAPGSAPVATSSGGVGSAGPPKVSLLPVLEPVVVSAPVVVPAQTVPADRDWVEAWGVDAPQEAPPRVEAAAAWTSGYLLPELPATGRQDEDRARGSEESAHAGY